jgi:hypothetical protein
MHLDNKSKQNGGCNWETWFYAGHPNAQPVLSNAKPCS